MEITKPIRLIELFGGIGSQAMALRDIGANFEHWKLVEFDKYAVQSYNAIHGTKFITTDIREVHGPDLGIKDKDKYTYIMTYSFPCTDLSVAGKMQGMSKKEWENGNSTRSGLLWEVERILKECDELPQVLLMENVPQVHAEQNKDDFESWLAFLRSKGYYNHYADLNAKDYGIPQNRDRCFCVSILSKEYIEYDFPEAVKSNLRAQDFLEKKVDEKFYIPDNISNEMLKTLSEGKGKKKELKIKNGIFTPFDKAISYTLFSRDFWKSGFKEECTTLNARDYKGPKILIEKNYIEIRQATKDGVIRCKIGGIFDGSYPESQTRRGRVQDEGDTSPTLTAGCRNINYVENQYRIRKLTPREYWRLMGYTDADFDKAQQSGMSNTQLYKQAGNAIVKQVLMAIFKQMIPA